MFLYGNVWMHDNMADSLWKFVQISTIMWVFEVVCVIFAKPTFLHSLDIPIKMLSITVSLS